MANSQIQKEFPKNGEQQALQAVAQDARLEAATKQAADSIVQDNQSCSFGCCWLLHRHLSVSIKFQKRKERIGEDFSVHLLYDTLVSLT